MEAAGIPAVFLNEKYTFEQADVGGVSCLIVRPIEELDTINAIKKHMARLHAVSGRQIVFELAAISRQRRKSFIDAKIAFVVPEKQVHIALSDDAVLTPLPLDQEISSISAILLDDVYYQFLRNGRVTIDGVLILDAMHLIPFKAKAWLDLNQRKETCAKVDSKNIRKHKNDVIRLSMLLRENDTLDLPQAISKDMQDFLAAMSEEAIDLKALGIRGSSQEEITGRLLTTYILNK